MCCSWCEPGRNSKTGAPLLNNGAPWDLRVRVLEPQLQRVLEDSRSAAATDVTRAREVPAANSIEAPEIVRHDEVRPVEEVERLDA